MPQVLVSCAADGGKYVTTVAGAVPNEIPEVYSQQNIEKDLQKNIPPQPLIYSPDLQNNESKNSEIICLWVGDVLAVDFIVS